MKSHKTAKDLAIITMTKPNESCYNPEGQAGVVKLNRDMTGSAIDIPIVSFPIRKGDHISFRKGNRVKGYVITKVF